MKKTITLTLLVVLTSAVYAFGSACPTTSYNVYNTAGFSCGIDDKTFFNFSYSTAGTTPMPSSSITVNPITTFHNPGFLFNAPWGVTSGQTQDSLVGFTVTVNPGGALITDLSLSMFGAGFVGTGVVSVAETYCLGDTFSDGCAHGTPGSLLTILDSSTSKLFDHASFAGVTEIDVMKDIELLGGTDGSAALLSGVENQFSETSTTPEPGSLVLFGSGIVCLAGALRRKLSL
jgi:hypothetical protein